MSNRVNYIYASIACPATSPKSQFAFGSIRPSVNPRPGQFAYYANLLKSKVINLMKRRFFEKKLI